MKKFFISFIHQPKKVTIVSLIIAIIIGIFGYNYIHKTPVNKFTGQEETILQDVSLSFVSSGKVKEINVETGDKVKKGDVLAIVDADNEDGSLIQAKAAYETAKANYQKVINGATGTAVDLARTTVKNAEISLEETTKQQGILVDNAYRTLLNSTLQVESVGDYDAEEAPTVSGTYSCKKEGSYELKTYNSTGGISVKYSGLEDGILFLTDIPRPLGNCGLLLSASKTKDVSDNADFVIRIPNKNAVNYNSNNNAYQLALQTKDQAIAGAKAVLEQAQASLNVVAANARPEDVAVAEAQVENAYGILIANAGYNNTIIKAPADGVVKDVYITPGQLITSGDKAILFSGSNI